MLFITPGLPTLKKANLLYALKPVVTSAYMVLFSGEQQLIANWAMYIINHNTDFGIHIISMGMMSHGLLQSAGSIF